MGCVAAPSVLPPRAAAVASDVLDIAALMQAMAAVPERHQRFREERRFTALSFPLILTGTLHYWRPSRFEKRTETPERELLKVDGDRIELTVGNEPTQHIDLGRSPEMQALVNAFRAPLSGDLATLQRYFRMEGSGSPERWLLKLQPLEPRAARLLREVRLGGVAAEVRSTVWVQGNGDEYAMQTEPLP
ncbi:MAG TPA: LolA-related protein [Crenalkalicoccus sp.]|nr:LolA-related protein [Crenalkalicoccus sp.]